MRKQLVVLLCALVLTASSVPGFAGYRVNWMTGFEQPTYQPGPLAGQDRWFTPDNLPATEVSMEVAGGQGLEGSQAAVQRADCMSGAARDMRYLNENGETFDRGYAKFWVYDPGDVGGLMTYGQAGIYSSLGADSSSSMITAGIRSSQSRDYWTYQWSYYSVVGDGVSSTSGTGYSYVPGPAAHRVHNAWSSVLIHWDYRYSTPDKSQGSATIKFFINNTLLVPNMTVNFDSTYPSRWANVLDVAGIFIGSPYATNDTNPAAFDNIEFHHAVIPEPSSLLALGGGMIGLLGLIRRRR